jgi:ABC-type nitrate/sulfonate/bicarbonate transport system substrate-binding protein
MDIKQRRENMKKRAVFLTIVVLMVISLTTIGCDKTPSGNAPETGNEYNGLMKIYETLGTVQEPTKVRYGGGIGLHIGMPLYVAYYTGALKKAGIDFEFHHMGTGPMQIEALKAGELDFGGCGVGGLAVGAAANSTKLLCYILEESMMSKFYVDKDSPLGKTQLNSAGFYGSATDWRGKKVYMPPGTILQYLMGFSLAKIGLTLQDITPVYMDVNNVNTAMYGRQGDVWGIWNFLCYAPSVKEEGFVPVVEGRKVGIELVTCFQTTEPVWNTPKLRAAIEKLMQFHFATAQWMYADPKNLEIAAQIATEWNESEGYDIPFEANLQYLSDTKYYTLEDNFDMFQATVTGPHGEMIKALNSVMSIMDFYVAQGNFTEDDRAAMIRNQKSVFLLDGLNAVKNSR